MNVGFSKKRITPSLGVELAGFDALRIADSILNELYVKTILIELDDEIFGFVSYDLLAVDHLIIDKVKAYMTSKKMPADHIIFCATHTHSGPQRILDTSRGFLKSAIKILGEPDGAYIECIVEASIKSIEEARMGMEKGTFKLVNGTLDGLGSNRNNQTFVGDTSVTAIEVEKTSGSKAVIVLAACHPTILSFDNTAISGDFISAYSDSLSNYDVAMYLNGSCGDISTRFTRKGNGYDEVLRMGNLLAEKVKNMLYKKEELRLNHFKVKAHTYNLKAKEADTIEDAKAKVKQAKADLEKLKGKETKGTEFRVLQSFLEGANANLNYANAFDGTKEIAISISIIEMNDDIFICVPGELFSELTKEGFSDNVHFITYANGYVMYFANKYAYDNHFYESYSSPFQRGESERLMEFIKKEITKL